MGGIVIDNMSKKHVTVAENQSVLKALQAHQIDWMHACGGKGRCTTCRFRVLSGIENIHQLTAAEEKYRNQGLLMQQERLACQATLRGEIIVAVPEDCKLPHLLYSY